MRWRRSGLLSRPIWIAVGFLSALAVIAANGSAAYAQTSARDFYRPKIADKKPCDKCDSFQRLLDKALADLDKFDKAHPDMRALHDAQQNADTANDKAKTASDAADKAKGKDKAANAAKTQAQKDATKANNAKKDADTKFNKDHKDDATKLKDELKDILDRIDDWVKKRDDCKCPQPEDTKEQQQKKTDDPPPPPETWEKPPKDIPGDCKGRIALAGLQKQAKDQIFQNSPYKAEWEAFLEKVNAALEKLDQGDCPKTEQRLAPPEPPPGGAPADYSPASDVAKNDVVLIDARTQQILPDATVVIIPQDPQKPIQRIAVKPDGSVTITQHDPDDRIVFIPRCNQKVILDGRTIGDGGARLRIPAQTLRLTVRDKKCADVNEKMVDRGLADQYKVRQLPAPADKWRGSDFCFGEGKNQRCSCLIEVANYAPLNPLRQACGAPAGGRKRPGGGAGPPPPGGPPNGDDDTPLPKDGPTITEGGTVIEADQPREIQGPAPNDPYATSRGSWGQAYEDQWYLKAVRWLKDDGTTVLPPTAPRVTVAVIDTGVDFSHPELAWAKWINPNPGPAGDLNGWNFIDNSPDVRDESGHGTIIAGVIAAATGNGLGIAGINPWARIMALKAMELDGHGGSIKLAQAIAYAADHGARVINVSVGGRTLTRHEQDAIDYAAQQGALIVVASGNQGAETTNYSPAGLKNVLAVAAVGPDLKRQPFSNWGATIGIAAPGVDILSLRARQTDLLQMTRREYRPGTAIVGEQYYRVTGSSFAAPIVSGAASLLFSMNPKLTAAQVKRMLLQSARDLEGIGMNQFSGYGLLDIEAAAAADPNAYVEAAITGVSAMQVRGKTVLRVTGTADADRLKEARIEIGAGDNPDRWTKVSRTISSPVVSGVLDDLATDAFRAGKQWTVRVIVVHRNGRQREARFKLSLG